MTQEYPLDPSSVDPASSPTRGAQGFPDAFGAGPRAYGASDPYGSAPGQSGGRPFPAYVPDDPDSTTARGPLQPAAETVMPPDSESRPAATRARRAPRRRRGPFAWLVDTRGLTFLGALIVAGVIGTVGGLIDAGAHAWVGTMFEICFIAGCVLGVLLVHREDLITMAFLPPVLFVAIASAVGVAQAMRTHGRIKDRLDFQVLYALAFGGATLWVATGVTVAAVLVRLAFRRRPASRVAYRAAP
jgi:hypothetical protein